MTAHKKKRKPLNKDYLDFLKYKKKRVKPTTLKSMERRFNTFPENPKELNTEHFENRLGTISHATLRLEYVYAKQFYEFMSWDMKEIKFKLPKIPRTTVTIEDLYTAEELERILKVLDNPRDRAMIEVLYESACRAGELMSMTIENLRFEPDSPIVTAIISGKTGTREAYLKDSVPSLKRWLDMHPSGKGKLWRNRKAYAGKFPPIDTAGLDNVVRQALKRSGIKGKKKVTHMFRHTRATELVRKGIRGQVFSKLMGWTAGSAMEQVYVHLSTADVKNEIASKVFGMETEAPQADLLKSSTCPKCHNVNPQGSMICEKCNLPLSTDLIVQAITEKSNLEQRIGELETSLKEAQETSTDALKKQIAEAVQAALTEALKAKKD